jgi:hypothetical protein
MPTAVGAGTHLCSPVFLLGPPFSTRPLNTTNRPPLRLGTRHKRTNPAPPQTSTGGGGTIDGGSGRGWSGGGGGGGGSGGGGGGNGANNNDNTGGFGWKGWRDRVAYDPEFPFKVLLEQVIGVGASVIGDMSSRPNWGMNELDFVFATLVVGSVVNFSLMYLLAPTAAAAAAVPGAAAASAKLPLLQRLLSDHYLKIWGAPGGNMFEPGAFTAAQRLTNFFYKGVVFATIGLAAGVVGTSISNGLIEVRKRMDPSFVQQNEPPSVLGNAACWSLHMGLSSNLRYQALGGADRALVKMMPQAAFRLYGAVVRAVNNAVGGISFVVIARAFGVQKSAAQAEVVEVKGKKAAKKAKAAVAAAKRA